MKERARILVIDDDQSIRETVRKALEQAGYEVDIAENGKEAIKKSEANFYNLALVDIRLPDMEGTKLLTEMKETIPKMIKIIVTGYPSLENAVEAVNRNADGYITKPLEMVKLLEMVKEQLMKQQEAIRYDQQKIAEYIETRARELEKLR